MTIPVSTAPSVKAALVALITDAVAQDRDPDASDPVVGVWYSDVGQIYPNDNIIVGKISQTMRPTRMIGSGGALWMNESYSIEIDIAVYRGDIDGQQDAEERVWHLAGVVANAVRADPSVGSTVTYAYPAAIDVDAEWIDEEVSGWQGTGEMRIEITDNPL